MINSRNASRYLSNQAHYEYKSVEDVKTVSEKGSWAKTYQFQDELKDENGREEFIRALSKIC